jgi:hypothetical protein
MRINLLLISIFAIILITLAGCSEYAPIENLNISVTYDISSKIEPQFPDLLHAIYTVKMTVVNNGNRSENDIRIISTLKERLTDYTNDNETHIKELKPGEIQTKYFNFERSGPERLYLTSYKVYTRP